MGAGPADDEEAGGEGVDALFGGMVSNECIVCVAFIWDQSYGLE